MYRILTASADTYITNKIIDNSFRAKDANVGQAGTLDLFKLFFQLGPLLTTWSSYHNEILVLFFLIISNASLDKILLCPNKIMSGL